MTTNRYLIDDTPILRPTQLLDKGIPLPFLSGRLRVDEGSCAVISEGGAFKEILLPGTHYLDKYKFFRDVLATVVDLRVQTLSLTTKDEFTIAQPVPVKINLDLSVEYRVTDARRVVMEVKSPVLNLYDRVIQAVRGVIVHATYDEFRTQGEMSSRSTLQRLQAMTIPEVLGIEVLNVLVTSITGADPVAQQHIKEYTTVRNWQLDSAITLNTRVTPEWLMINRPEIYQQLLAGNTTLMKELIDKGLLDPSGFMNQPAGTVHPNIANVIGLLGGATLPQFPGLSPVPTPLHGLSSQTAPVTPPGGDVRARIQEDLEYLREFAKTVPGATASAAAVADQSTELPDGRYIFNLEFVSRAGNTYTLTIRCPVGYPKVSPTLEVMEDGKPVPFPSAVLSRWSANYIVEIAREVQDYYG